MYINVARHTSVLPVVEAKAVRAACIVYRENGRSDVFPRNG